jgi:hypothetical protein
MQRWVIVFTSHDVVDAELAHARLVTAGVPSLMARNTGALFVLGEHTVPSEVLVPEERVAEAHGVLREARWLHSEGSHLPIA